MSHPCFRLPIPGSCFQLGALLSGGPCYLALGLPEAPALPCSVPGCSVPCPGPVPTPATSEDALQKREKGPLTREHRSWSCQQGPSTCQVASAVPSTGGTALQEPRYLGPAGLGLPAAPALAVPCCPCPSWLQSVSELAGHSEAGQCRKAAVGSGQGSGGARAGAG